jgi:nickel-dependent lactate racemase
MEKIINDAIFEQDDTGMIRGAGAESRKARLIGTSITSGSNRQDQVKCLEGRAFGLTVSTHEHFGDIQERIDLPADWDIHVQHMAGAETPALGPNQILARLRYPIGTLPLRELAAGKTSAVITFDDLTRPTPMQSVVPLVIRELETAGVPPDRIIFLNSCGMHRNLEQDEAVRKLGLSVLRRYAWTNHNIWDNLQEVGTTTYGNVIKLNRTFLAAQVRVTISGVKIHGFAGYGGGSKAVMPGVAGVESILFNHNTVMRNLKRRVPGEVSLFKNDVRADMDEAARLAGVDFSVQIVYNAKRQVCGIFAGDIVEAHRDACRFAVKHYQTEQVCEPDVVICNSYPQGTQAEYNSWIYSVRPGGTSVLIIQNPQGLSAVHYWAQHMEARNGMTYFDVLASKPQKWGEVRLIVYSQYLDKRQMSRFPEGTTFAHTWEDVIRCLQKRHEGYCRAAVYPYAGIQHSHTRLDE